jgi:hypothetical protein
MSEDLTDIAANSFGGCSESAIESRRDARASRLPAAATRTIYGFV